MNFLLSLRSASAINSLILIAVLLGCTLTDRSSGAQITTNREPAQLAIGSAGENSLRITLKPKSFTEDYPSTPVLVENKHQEPSIIIDRGENDIQQEIGNFIVTVSFNPLTVKSLRKDSTLVQELVFQDNGQLSFNTGENPILGLGEGGPNPGEDVEWRELPVEFDRQGRYHNMLPRWQPDAYGSRNPVPLLAGTDGWGLFVAAPWVQVDLRDPGSGAFIPYKMDADTLQKQNQTNQQANLGKGLPPVSKAVPGLFDVFVFDAQNPLDMMKDIAEITGKAVMPPKWSLGYMQSHRTLDDGNQMIEVVDNFRKKQIPLDAVIYLGTGFCPSGWNTEQPSFDFNPEVFKREPSEVIDDLHERNVKVVVHMVPWDRDKLPSLHGQIPPRSDEVEDSGHILNYWGQHVSLVEDGIDAFWPDEGDWFDLFERIKRHQLYYQGPLSTTPNVRPWSLHRNGYLGIAQWGGWVWSGDTESSWKSLEAQIAVGLNHGISLSPYWGSDIGGFFPNEELDGELYARWFQFGAFCPSFRSHGKTWWTRLPWGWGLSEMGPKEHGNNPLESSLNDHRIEPICKKYAELRYQLLPYNYTLGWEAKETGLPFMRALWLHYPTDQQARKIGDEYLWGRDMLVAPVYLRSSTSKEIYLPDGQWYDWWTLESYDGGGTVIKEVNLETMPIYVRAGAIIPLDPVRQYVNQKVSEPTTLKIFTGQNGEFTLYEDDGISLDYLKGSFSLTNFSWNNDSRTLSISSGSDNDAVARTYKIELVPEGNSTMVNYGGEPVGIKL